MSMADINQTAVLVAALAAVPPTLASVASIIVAVRASDKVDDVAVKVEQVHIATNSMKDALVKSTREAALQEGHTEGVKDEKIRSLGKIH